MDNIVEKQKPHMQKAMEEDEDGMSVPNWLLEVIAFITRMEMANPPSMATSCRLFKQLCWSKLHGNVEPYRVTYLDYSKYLYRGYTREIFPYPEMQKKIKIDSEEVEVIPVACSPPPDYIIGFDNIRICFLDDHIIEFMQNIAPLLANCNLSYITYTRRWTNDEEKTLQMRRLLGTMGGKIFKFNSSDLFDCQLFPDVIDQVECGISIRQYQMHSDVLFNWLINNNGSQKTLYLNNGGQTKYQINAFVNRIKKEFSNATNAVKFIIHLRAFFREFRMENEQTGEILELRNYRNAPYEYRRRECILVRYAAGQNWNIEGEEEMNGRSGKTEINVQILDI